MGSHAVLRQHALELCLGTHQIAACLELLFICTWHDSTEVSYHHVKNKKGPCTTASAYF